MVIDDREENPVESLKVTVSTTVKEDELMVEKSEDITVTASATEETPNEEVIATPSWAATLNLRNLLDILKAPFVRNSKKN